MPSTRGPTATLVADTVRAHRRGVVAWVLGGSFAMLAIALGLASEAERFEGGLPGLARSVEAGAQAMRLLRWPAERIDTVGGYVTYHNVTLFALFLSLYAGAQGVGAIRGAEPSLGLDAVLATGRSRAAVVRDRALGFVVSLAIIGAGVGVGLAVAMAAAGASDVSGSLLSSLACVICAFVAYAFGALVGQVLGTARGANGMTAVVLTGLYLLTNVADEIGPFGVVRYISPFYAFTRSRALVPGRGFDIGSAALAVLVGVALLVLAAWAFAHRDVGAPLWSPRQRRTGHAVAVQRPALHRLWTAVLLRERLGLVAWAAATAVAMALLAWLEPSVRDVWEDFGMVGGVSGASISDQYLAFAAEIIGPIVAAFVITQAAGWVADLEQGRVELVLSTPLSWARLIEQRMLALAAGVAVLVMGAVVGLFVGTVAVGVSLDPVGLVRLAVVALLFGLAFGGLAALLVAWLRTTAAVLVLALVTAASYLLVVLVTLFAWPDWLVRLSVFGAFGHPYLEVPAWSGLAFLVVLAVAGSLLAAVVSQRTPKTG